MAGGGAAGVEAGQTYQKSAAAMELERAREEATLARETALQKMKSEADVNLQQNVIQPHQSSEKALDREATAGENAATRALTKSEGGLNRENQRELQDVRIAFDRDQLEQTKILTREQINAHKAIASSNNSIALQIAKLGGAPTQDKQGNMIWINKDGSSQKIMDPADPTKQLQGFKDLTPAAKAMMSIKQEELKGLNQQEASGMGDPAKISERRLQLNREILNIATTGIEDPAKGGGAAPYADGTRLTGPDKQMYVVVNGQPVLESEAKAKGKGAPASMPRGLVTEPPGTPPIEEPVSDDEAVGALNKGPARGAGGFGKAQESARLRKSIIESERNPSEY
jgi:hypothetical protein